MTDDTTPRELPFPDADDDAALVARLQASYAALPSAPADAIARCTMHALRGDTAPATRAVRGGERGAVRQRWWWGAAAAAVLVVTVARPWRLGNDTRHVDSVFSAPVPGAIETPSTVPVGSTRSESGAVTFEIRLPASAAEVAVVGDFNGWDERATPMVRDGAGWSARVPLPPGRHVYAFVVDGQRWLVDPLAPQVPDAGFGPANALVVEGSR